MFAPNAIVIWAGPAQRMGGCFIFWHSGSYILQYVTLVDA